MRCAESTAAFTHWNGMESLPSTLGAIGEAIQSCRRCPIGCNGTNAVMVEGLPTAPLMVLGKPVFIGRMRRKPFAMEGGAELWITAHPSYIMCLKDEPRMEQEVLFMRDLRQIAGRLSLQGG